MCFNRYKRHESVAHVPVKKLLPCAADRFQMRTGGDVSANVAFEDWIEMTTTEENKRTKITLRY